LFQGRTYYSHSWYPACSLLLGGKPGYEKATLDKNTLFQLYFGHNVFYSLIADRTVKNMVKTDKGWKVEYNEGGTLTVDFANMTSAMTFVLEVDGKVYTPDNPPASPYGIKAKRINGKYELCSVN
jgi:hypothetical protein